MLCGIAAQAEVMRLRVYRFDRTSGASARGGDVILARTCTNPQSSASHGAGKPTTYFLLNLAPAGSKDSEVWTLRQRISCQ